MSLWRNVCLAAFVAGWALLISAMSQPALAQAPPAVVTEHQEAPVAVDQAEAKVLAVLEELDAYRKGTMNVPREDGRLLRILAESIGAKRVVELGTSNGYSGIWMCLALRQTGGHLITFEIDEGRAAMARENFAKAGVADLITIVMGDAHENVLKLDETPIDLIFIDADKPGYPDYLEKLLPKVRPGGLIVAHNTSWPAPDPAFIEAITTNPALDTLFINVTNQGMSVSVKKRTAGKP